MPYESITHGDERGLIARAQCGDAGARNELIVRHWPLIGRLARRYGGGSADRDDRRQEAVFGAIEAIERFDLDRPVKLSTYLGWKVRRALTASTCRDRPSSGVTDGPDPRDGRAELGRADELARLADSFDGLGPLDRCILDLRHRRGLSASAVARRLRRKRSVVRALERVALARLRILMG